MERKEYIRLGERMESCTLDNGLRIFVVPKPEFHKNFAFFATNYGGMDLRFLLDGQWQDSPAGVAHYLEHKMFDTEHGNALQELAESGASPNAFTSNAITGYFFECTEQFERNLEILLSFVSVPWFTQESVDKERGIIAQEIRMYEDSPDWCVTMNLLRAMYRSHPIRVSVAGSVESIQDITPETLYACHRGFYNPANMVLCVAGDVDAQRVAELAERVLPRQPGQAAQRDRGQPEPEGCERACVEERMEVSAPLFQLGFKGDAAANGAEELRQQLLGDLAAEALLGSSSPLYARLYEQGLINANFGYGYSSYPGCAFLSAGGESRDPEAVRQAVWEEAARLAEQGIDEALWERLQKASYGSQVRALNSFEHICVGQAQAYFAGYNLFDFPEVYQTIRREDAQALIARWVREERTSLSIVRPLEARTA